MKILLEIIVTSSGSKQYLAISCARYFACLTQSTNQFKWYVNPTRRVNLSRRLIAYHDVLLEINFCV